MWIFIAIALVVAVILCAIFVKSDLEKTEWAEEIGRDCVFGTEIDINWNFPPEDPMHYDTYDIYKYDIVTLMLHFKDGTQKRIIVKDKGEPYDEYHLYLPKIIGDNCENDREDFSSLKAIKEAKDCLYSVALSYKELTNQLISDGFSPEDAEYGVRNCGANWNLQALKAAKEYLNVEAYSYESLKKQLIEEELFTPEQAEYGVRSCRADWNLQAAKSAREYLAAEIFSSKVLKEQLIEEELFTPEEAEYGVRNCGADWGIQAVRCIKEYCDPEEDSKEEIAETLADEGFTENEINYAITKMRL